MTAPSSEAVNHFDITKGVALGAVGSRHSFAEERAAMNMSRDARFMCGLALILVPTIVYGGLALLGVLSGGAYGMPAPRDLSPLQASLYRAGHAHAGVLTILGLVLQIIIDDASVPASLMRPVRVAALSAPLFVAGGFFGLAHVPGLRILLYLGAALVFAATLTVGVSLLRAR